MPRRIDPFTWVPIQSAQNLHQYVQLVLGAGEEWSGVPFAKDRDMLSEKEQQRSESEIWYRGLSSVEHGLVPGAHRPPRKGKKYDTASMYNRFSSEGAGLLDPRPADDWEWYFAAQHYGIPTRLLDWTEDALVALYFALRSDTDENVPLRKDISPVVWLMDAGSLNKISVGEDIVYLPTPGGPVTRHWLPSAIETKRVKKVFKGSNSRPIAIYPAHTTRRIAAQSGYFTVHGHDAQGIESYFRGHRHLARIRIADPPRIDRELHHIGYTKFKLFPEPSYLAARLRRFYTGP